MEQPYSIEPDLHVLPALVPVPAIGLLPANAFLITGAQPYLVDTGLLADGESFVEAVSSILDPADLRWIYLTHVDPDHIGALGRLLDRAPEAKVVTTFVALAKLQLQLRPLPPPRVRLLNPGQQLDLGDRVLSVLRPPIFDAPETTAVHDSRLDALFSADAFGAPLPQPFRLANDIPADTLEQGQLLWPSVDAPWIHHIDRGRFADRLREITDLDPAWVLSAHLPPARRLARVMCDTLARAPDNAPFVAPDQEAFEALMKEIAESPVA